MASHVCRAARSMPRLLYAAFGRRQCTTTSTSTTTNTTANDSSAEHTDSAEHVLELERMRAENERLSAVARDVDDKYKRSLADAENTRARMRRQVDETKLFAVQAFAKDLLAVADVLRTALESAAAPATDADAALRSLYAGVESTERQLQAVLRRHGVTPICPLGQRFDPNQHHALFEVSDAHKEAGTVAVVQQIGYKLHERTIRPAMVGVVKHDKQ